MNLWRKLWQWSQTSNETPVSPAPGSPAETPRTPLAARRQLRIAWQRRILQALGILLFLRIAQLQLLEGRVLFQMAEDNRTRVQHIAAPRGRILDRNGVELVTSRPVYNLLYDPETESAELDFDALAETADLDIKKMRAAFVRDANDPAKSPVRIAEDLSTDQAARIQPRLSQFPGLTLEIEPRRTYPLGATAAHVLGTVGLMTEEEWEALQADPQKRFAVEDRIGKTGIEKALNDVLVGQPGSRGFEVDAQGRRIQPLGESEPLPGQDVVLNLDVRLQRLVEKAFGKWKGAVVAIDPRNGEVLALHSNPRFDPSVFAGRSHAKELQALLDDPEQPLMNRAVQSSFQPGSVFKIVSSLAGWKSGAITQGTTHQCTGTIHVLKKTWHCWNEKGHGTVDPKRALVESCNIFFFETALQIDEEPLAEMGATMGLGSLTGIELPEEEAGIMPSPEWKKRELGEPWWDGETLSVIIGQGMLQVTPLQAANLAAMVATGVRYQPRLVRATGDAPKEAARLDVDSRVLENVRGALWSVVNEGGTGARASNTIFPLAGKTGTAQVAKLENAKGSKTPHKLRDHNWFVAYAPYDAPELAIVVFIENGGEKGKNAKTEIGGRIAKEYLTLLHPEEVERRKKAAEEALRAAQALARKEEEEKARIAAEEQARYAAIAEATQTATRAEQETDSLITDSAAEDGLDFAEPAEEEPATDASEAGEAVAAEEGASEADAARDRDLARPAGNAPRPAGGIEQAPKESLRYAERDGTRPAKQEEDARAAIESELESLQQPEDAPVSEGETPAADTGARPEGNAAEPVRREARGIGRAASEGTREAEAKPEPTAGAESRESSAESDSNTTTEASEDDSAAPTARPAEDADSEVTRRAAAKPTETEAESQGAGSRAEPEESGQQKSAEATEDSQRPTPLPRRGQR